MARFFYESLFNSLPKRSTRHHTHADLSSTRSRRIGVYSLPIADRRLGVSTGMKRELAMDYRPTISRASLLDGARNARGCAVIIDVYRAATTMCVLLAAGVERLWLVGDVARAIELRRGGLVDACIGEIEGRPVPGFDHGNSPSEVAQRDWRGKRVVLSTRSGVVGLEAARQAQIRLAASFVNASATVRFVLERRPAEVTLVAMGWAGRERTEEDEACADLLEAKLTGREVQWAPLLARVQASAESRKFGDPMRPWFPEADREMALDVDRYDFAVLVVPDGDFLRAHAVRPPTANHHACG